MLNNKCSQVNTATVSQRKLFPGLRSSKRAFFMCSLTDSPKNTLAKNKSKQVILMSLIRHWGGDYWQAAWGKCVPPVISPVSH